MGRFLSADPLPGNPFQSGSTNRYAYALNNPITYEDVSGLAARSQGTDWGNVLSNFVSTVALIVLVVALIVLAILVFMLLAEFLVPFFFGGALALAGGGTLAAGSSVSLSQVIAAAATALAALIAMMAASGSSGSGGSSGGGSSSSSGGSSSASDQAQQAVENAKADPNKVNHIFNNPSHDHMWNLTGLDQEGNWNLIQQTLENNYSQLPQSGAYEVSQNYGSYSVTVRGAVVNGNVRIGTAFVNPVP